MALTKLANSFDKVAKSSGIINTIANHIVSMPKPARTAALVGAGTLVASALTKSDSPLKDAAIAGGVGYAAHKFGVPFFQSHAKKTKKKKKP